MITKGSTSFDLYPCKYNLVLVEATSLVAAIDTQSSSSSSVSIALGGIIEVINPLSSFVNASLLNPSDMSANWPKFEFDFVIDL